jgi:methionyl-tRNA formyltransferase
LRVVFAGTPSFAARALEAIVEAGHEVPLVLTRPDKPAGRGLRVASSAVAQLAASRGIRVEKPASLRDAASHELLRSARSDVMVVAAYGLLLPAAILAIPPRGCINIHASLLPRWRGAAPIQRAILAGDRETGVSIMRMEEGLDTGPVIFTVSTMIAARETAGTLTERLADLGAGAIVDALARIDRLEARPQDDSKAVYAPKISKGEALIDWQHSSEEIDRRIRAFNPAPGAEGRIAGSVLKIWAAESCDGAGRPGEILDCDTGRFVVGAGRGAIGLTEVQRPGGKRLSAADFLRGANLARGQLFEASEALGPDSSAITS